MDGAHRRVARGYQLAMGVVAPMATLAAAFGLVTLSNRLLQIGPLDRAAFGWLTVMPLLIMTPVVAGFAWQSLGRMETLGVATVVGGSALAVVGSILWESLARIQCQTESLISPVGAIVPALAVGASFGGSMAVAGCLVAELVRHRRARAAVFAGIALGMAVLLISLVAFLMVMPIATCARP